MKNVYYAYITELSSLFVLECEEHVSHDESSGGGKCKEQCIYFCINVL